MVARLTFEIESPISYGRFSIGELTTALAKRQHISRSEYRILSWNFGNTLNPTYSRPYYARFHLCPLWTPQPNFWVMPLWSEDSLWSRMLFPENASANGPYCHPFGWKSCCVLYDVMTHLTTLLAQQLASSYVTFAVYLVFSDIFHFSV